MAYVEQYISNEAKSISWYSSVLFKIIVTVLLAAMLVIAISGFFGYRYIEKLRTNELQVLADVTVERLALHLQGPMWAVDYEKVGALLEAEMSEQRIRGLIVRDEDGAKLFAAKERLDSGVIRDSLGGMVGNYLQASAPVVKGDKTIGDVSVYLTRSILSAELAEFAKGISALAAILAAVLTVAIGMALMIFVVRPIKQLTNHAMRISDGDLRHKLGVTRSDEIGYLGATITRMQHSLLVAVKRIQKNKQQASNTTGKQSFRVAS